MDWTMVQSKRWMGMAAMSLTMGCVAPQSGEQETGAQESAGSESTGELPDDGIDAQVECSNRAALDATAEELAINGRADVKVGLELLGELGEAKDNVLLSPFSLRTAFGQVYAGTSGASRTEIERVLAFDALGDRTHEVLGYVAQTLETRNAEETEYEPALILSPANRSYFDLPFEKTMVKSWKTRVEDAYGVCFEFFELNRDLERTRNHINAWVAHETHDKIPELVKFLPPEVSAVIVNALYFRASWATPFEESLTAPGMFTNRKGATVQVEMMHAPLLGSSHAQGDDWEAVAIPYSDSRLEMVVVLPSGDPAAFEANLDEAALDGMFDALTPTIVDLTLPKFDIKSTWTLSGPLMSLGMEAPFMNGFDFAGIAPGMYPIFEVFHDVAIAIDEKGTEAAAATAIVFGDEGGEEPVPEFTVVVDRTFYLAIRDRDARGVMFFARIGDPKASS
jgi:serine protease inhibitor